MSSPAHLVFVTGTGTEVGKTWWTVELIRALRRRGVVVAARKPVQSFALGDTATDAHLLGAATGEEPETVCPPDRWLAAPMAPPIAAEHLGLPRFTIADLALELTWSRGVGVGLVEGAGGLRSPLADDGDSRALIELLHPDDVLVVAHAGLGVIHAVRLVGDAVAGRPVTVALNRFDPADRTHRANHDWLGERDGFTVVTRPEELAQRWA